MLEQQLKKLGFTENETKIYLSLFELGKSKAGKIIEYTGLHRNLVYSALEVLAERDLIFKVLKKGVAVFEANDPKALVDVVEQQKVVALEAAEELKKKQPTVSRDIRVYEGMDGIIQSRERSLDLPPGETMYVLGGTGSTSLLRYEKYWMSYHRRRIKKGIPFKILFDHTTLPEFVKARNALPHTEARYLPTDIDLPTYFDAFGDILSIGVVDGDDSLVFSFRSAKAAESIRKFFNYFWNQQVTTERGLAAVHRAFYNMVDELQPGEEYYVLGGNFGLTAENMYDFFDEFHGYRVKKGVVANILAHSSAHEQIKRTFDKVDKERRVSKLRYLSTGDLSPVQINLYKDKAVLIVYGDNPAVFTINQKEIYQNFKSYFDQLWGQEAYIVKGAKFLQAIWLESIDTGGIKFIDARGYFMDRYPDLMKPILEKMAKAKNVYWKNVVDNDMRGHRLASFPWSQTKFMATNNTHNLNVTWLWGDKAAVVNWAENEPVILVLENKHLVQSYHDYFDEMWKKAK